MSRFLNLDADIAYLIFVSATLAVLLLCCCIFSQFTDEVRESSRPAVSRYDNAPTTPPTQLAPDLHFTIPDRPSSLLLPRPCSPPTIHGPVVGPWVQGLTPPPAYNSVVVYHPLAMKPPDYARAGPPS